MNVLGILVVAILFGLQPLSPYPPIQRFQNSMS